MMALLLDQNGHGCLILDDRHLEGDEPGVLPDERPQRAADAEDRHAEEEADSKTR